MSQSNRKSSSRAGSRINETIALRSVPRILTIAVFLATGCSVGPRYKQPLVNLQPYHNAPAIGSRTALLPAPSLNSWWAGFNDPELTKIIQRALSENLDLVASLARVVQARAAAQEAGASRSPNFDLEESSTSSRQSIETPIVAELRWRLFDFGRVDAEVKQARGANAEAIAEYRNSVLRATEDVEHAFSALAESEVRRDEIAHEISSLQRAKDLSQQSYEAGVIPLTDVLDANRQLLVAKDDLASTREMAARAAVSSFRAPGGG